MSQQQTIGINGATISYRDAGKGDFPLIFIHPFPFSQKAWNAQTEALAQHMRVITYDVRGFGASTPGTSDASMDLYADDLVQLMDELGIQQAAACGLSMGGYILLNAVERHPQRFKAIILADTQCLADSKENREKRFTTIQDIETKGLEEFASGFVKNVFTEHTLKNNASLVEQTKQLILENSAGGICAALRAMANRHETCSDLKKINMPSLILCGKEDKLTPPSLSEYLFTNIPGAKLHEIENAAHLSNLEQPELFNRYVKEFIAAASI